MKEQIKFQIPVLYSITCVPFAIFERNSEKDRLRSFAIYFFECFNFFIFLDSHKMITRCSILVLSIVASAICSPTELPEDTLNGFKTVSKVYDDCASKEYSISSCLKLKALTLLDRAARSDNIAFSDSVIISKNADAKSRFDYGRAINEHELENEIKTGAANEVVASESDSKLNSLIVERVARFLSSHNVNIKLPAVSKDELGRALEESKLKEKTAAYQYQLVGT